MSRTLKLEPEQAKVLSDILNIKVGQAPNIVLHMGFPALGSELDFLKPYTQ
jgi:hypothetical protein